MTARATDLAAAVMLAGAIMVLGAGAASAAPEPQAAPPQASLSPAAAADSALEARTSAVASELRCPVCQGVSIQDSPSELAQQMRSLVKEQLAAGKSPDDVRAYFVSKYGEWILLEPKARGFNLLVYALPVLLIMGGLGVVAVVVRRWTATAESPDQPG